jgi:predicted acyl esterase
MLAGNAMACKPPPGLRGRGASRYDSDGGNAMRLLLVCLLLAAAVAPAFAAEPSYDKVVAMVAMSDGVRLDTSLYIPKQPAFGRLPLIVRQHGGGSNKDSPYDVNYGLKAVETGRFALLLY